MLKNERHNNNNNNNKNNGLKPFIGMGFLLPWMQNNHDFSSPPAPSCTALTGETGSCLDGNTCTLYGGTPSGTCGIRSVCCVSKFTRVYRFIATTDVISDYTWPTQVASRIAMGQSRRTTLIGNHQKILGLNHRPAP